MGRSASTEGYSSTVAFKVAGLSFRRGDYLARTGLVRPSLVSASGKGSARRYSFRDIVELRVVRALRDQGLPLQRVRKAVAALRRDWPRHGSLAEARLVVDGGDALLALDRDRFVSLLAAPGQTGWRSIVEVGRFAGEVRTSLHDLEQAAA